MEKNTSHEIQQERHKSMGASTRASSGVSFGSSSMYIVIIAMLCLLLVFSAVQAVQITKLKEAFQVGTTANLAAGSQGQPASQPAQSPAAQPQMVGGC